MICKNCNKENIEGRKYCFYCGAELINKQETVKKNTVNAEYDYLAAAEKQMALPEKGEQVAIMHIKDYGDVSIRLFPNVAPKAVENFVKHSQDGYYNGEL